MPSGSPALVESDSIVEVIGTSALKSSAEPMRLVDSRWERSETDSGIPYYINHRTGETHWDHPQLCRSFHMLDDINIIKYATYRTAAKLRMIQKTCAMHMVKLHSLERSFEQHGLGSGQNSSAITAAELEAVLQTVFALSKGDRPDNVLDPNLATQITLSWTLGLLDSGRTGLIMLKGAKTCLSAVCSASLHEKYTYIFEQVAHPLKRISADQLRDIVKDLLLIPKQVFESATFGDALIEPAVSSIYQLVNKQKGQNIDKEEFVFWMSEEPKFAVWLPTLHRLAASETMKHEAKCSTCKAFPIIGMRFRSLKSFSVDLCQNCYFQQKMPKNIKVTHPFREYNIVTTSGDDVRDFFKVFKNKLTRQYRNKSMKKTFLDHPDSPPEEETDAAQPRQQSPQRTSETQDQEGDAEIFQNPHTRIGHLADRLQELEVQSPSTQVTAEVHPRMTDLYYRDTPSKLQEYQRAEHPMQVEGNDVSFANVSYQPASVPLPTTHSRQHTTGPHQEGVQGPIPKPRDYSSRHLATQPVPVPRSQQEPDQSRSEPIFREVPQRQPSQSPDNEYLSPGVTIGPGCATGQRSPYENSRVLPSSVGTSEIRQFITDLVTQKDALVQELQDFKNTSALFTEPVTIEKQIGVDPELYSLQKSFMSARLDVKDTQIKQLEDQLKIARTQLAERAARDQLTERAARDQLTERAARDQFTERAARDQLTERAARDQLTERAARDQFTERAARDQLIERAARDQLTERAARDQLTERAARDQLTERAARDQLTERAARDQFTERAARDQLTERAAREKVQQPQPQTTTGSSSMTIPGGQGLVSRGVNISSSFMSEPTDRSFYGNPDEDLRQIVGTMINAFPTNYRKVAGTYAEEDMYKTAMKVSRCHTTYIQELTGE